MEFDANASVLLMGKLLRRDANKNTFPTEIVVDGYQARDHSAKRANARDVTFPDGRKLFLGSLCGRSRCRVVPTGKAADKTKTPDK